MRGGVAELIELLNLKIGTGYQSKNKKKIRLSFCVRPILLF